MSSLIGMLFIGLVAGAAAAFVMGSSRPGWIPTIAVGVLGSFVGGFLFNLLGFQIAGFPASLVSAVIGAVICIYAIRIWGPKL